MTKEDHITDGCPCGYVVDDQRISEFLSEYLVGKLKDGVIEQPYYDLAAALYELQERRKADPNSSWRNL